jgi:ABC-type nickel/cobalt efflux system permease component RcnA
MQRLVLAALLLAIIAGFVAVLVLGVRATVRDGGMIPRESEGSSLQKLAFAALVLLIAGVSTGLLGGL